MLKLHVSSVVLGAVLATGAFLLMSQAGPGVPYGSWGPPKTGVVNVYNAQGGTVPPGGSLVVFSVPTDRWLTLTGASAAGNCVPDLQTGSTLTFRFAELFAGNITVKGVSLATDSPVGWVFRPGSQVVVTNVGSGTCSVDSYDLIGYQTRD